MNGSIRGGGEDVELVIRLHYLGRKFEVLDSLEAIHAPHFKEKEENINSSKKNIQYIIKKHPLADVGLLGTLGWEDYSACKAQMRSCPAPCVWQVHNRVAFKSAIGRTNGPGARTCCRRRRINCGRQLISN
jgi:hypothetical protein